MAKKVCSSGGGGISWQKIVPTGLGVLLLAGFIYWATRPSATALLNVASPTPGQIRQIATTLLLDTDFKIRAKAAEKLTSLGQTAIPVLRDIAQTNSDPNLRKAVLDILVSLDPKGTADLMAQMSKDKDPQVQLAVISAAKAIDDPRSYDILTQGVRSQDQTARQAAVEGLGARRDARAVPDLEAALNDPNSSITVRRHAARSLQLITGRNYDDRVLRR
jgi:HEAT repeat protein